MEDHFKLLKQEATELMRDHDYEQINNFLDRVIHGSLTNIQLFELADTIMTMIKDYEEDEYNKISNHIEDLLVYILRESSNKEITAMINYILQWPEDHDLYLDSILVKAMRKSIKTKTQAKKLLNLYESQIMYIKLMGGTIDLLSFAYMVNDYEELAADFNMSDRSNAFIEGVEEESDNPDYLKLKKYIQDHTEEWNTNFEQEINLDETEKMIDDILTQIEGQTSIMNPIELFDLGQEIENSLLICANFDYASNIFDRINELWDHLTDIWTDEERTQILADAMNWLYEHDGSLCTDSWYFLRRHFDDEGSITVFQGYYKDYFKQNIDTIPQDEAFSKNQIDILLENYIEHMEEVECDIEPIKDYLNQYRYYRAVDEVYKKYFEDDVNG